MAVIAVLEALSL